ncbi:hypothetical protein [Nitrosospira sp. Nsp14]|uniref:hypothetical protein n=1 Tax=Nitrosospira sp. Nsp14 TaxID=1855333 RepID=UPI000B887F55|nr:hypothetical protein [Nitrosospira sp. Nsp14]
MESLAFRLQLTDKRQAVFDVIDMHRYSLPEPSKQDDADRLWRLSLDRMDLRRYNVNRGEESGLIEFEMRAPDNDVQKLIDDAVPEQEGFFQQIKLMNWTRNQFQKSPAHIHEVGEWRLCSL